MSLASGKCQPRGINSNYGHWDDCMAIDRYIDRLYTANVSVSPTHKPGGFRSDEERINNAGRDFSNQNGWLPEPYSNLRSAG
jgi:hypothetical protein